MKRAILAAMAIALLLSMPTGALAGKQDTYTDLAALQPPPNPAVDWDCWVNGAHIICDAQVLDTWESIEIDDLCDFSIYSINGSETRKIRRVHDLDGRQLWSRNVRDLRETLVLNPDGSGPSLRAFGHFVEEIPFRDAGRRQHAHADIQGHRSDDRWRGRRPRVAHERPGDVRHRR